MPETQTPPAVGDENEHVETLAVPPTKWKVVTSAQVERTYVVEAEDSEQAHHRLRQYLKDADALRPELVVQEPGLVNVTPEKVKGEVKQHKEK